MQFIERELFLDALSAVGNEELRVLDHYSGRGMYGKQCLGIAADSLSSITILLVTLAADDRDTALDMVERMRTDGFGHGIVAYFPGLQLESDEAEEQ